MSDKGMQCTSNEDLGAFWPSNYDEYPLDPFEVRLLLRIKRRAGSSGNCFESLPNIAKGCCMSLAKARAALRSLEAFGVVTIKRRSGYSSLCTVNKFSDWAKPSEIPNLRRKTPIKSGTTPLSNSTGLPLSDLKPVPLSNSTGLPLSDPIDEDIPIEINPLERTPLTPQGELESLSEEATPREEAIAQEYPQTSASLFKKEESFGAQPEIQSRAKTCVAATILPPEKKRIISDRENSPLRAEQKFLERAGGIPEYRTKRGANGIKPEFVEAIAKYLSSTPHYLERVVEADAIAAKRYIINQEEKGNQDLLVEQYQKHCAAATQESQEPGQNPQELPKYQARQESLLERMRGMSIMSKWNGKPTTASTNNQTDNQV